MTSAKLFYCHDITLYFYTTSLLTHDDGVGSRTYKAVLHAATTFVLQILKGNHLTRSLQFFLHFAFVNLSLYIYMIYYSLHQAKQHYYQQYGQNYFWNMSLSLSPIYKITYKHRSSIKLDFSLYKIASQFTLF